MLQDARDRFIAAVEACGGPEHAAVTLGCTRSYIDMLCQGKRDRPGMDVAASIEMHFGIPMRDWVEIADSKSNPKRRRAA
jgi:hypothetical protein